MEIRLYRAPWYAGAEVLIKGPEGYVHDFHLREYTEGMMIPPSLRIEDPAAQVLMDDLWQAGYRPTEGRGSAGALFAVEKHLADMRTIVAKQLDLKLFNIER